ncbi:MAG: aminotransferase [Pseudonocardiales bacterium]|nr:aminotransferase [Pseudonocardiales bacterium]
MHGFGTTIFAEMSALATRTGAINLGQGFPDTDGPPEVLEAAVEAIRSGHHNQYPPGPGLLELRTGIAAHQHRFYGLEFDADAEVLVTAGATEAIAATILALVGTGDEVVMFEPYYDSYAAVVALSGAQRRVVTLRRHDDGWQFDPAEFRAAITHQTKVILLNSPHNPTGKVFSTEELDFIAGVAIKHNLTVVSDEVYEHLVFEGRHVPIATRAGMRDRTVTISSAGKTFSVTGWKIGWICASPPLIAAVRTVKQFLTYVSGGPFQPAIAAGLRLPDECYEQTASQLRDRRDQLCAGLSGLGFDVVIPQATYFATVDVGSSAVEYCRDLPRRFGVAAIPSSVFYDSEAGDHLVRFAFCKRPAVIAEALARLGGQGNE